MFSVKGTHVIFYIVLLLLEVLYKEQTSNQKILCSIRCVGGLRGSGVAEWERTKIVHDEHVLEDRHLDPDRAVRARGER